MIKGQMKRFTTAKMAFVLLSASPAAMALPDTNTIDFGNCMLALPGTSYTAPAQCGFLEVPENPADPDGRTLSIHVAVAGATSTDTAPDPVFFFAGGPGQAASETWVMLRPVLDKIRKKRDIVMIDQRGTGRSNKLQCLPEGSDDLNAEVDLEFISRETGKCLASLDADPRFYTTAEGMRDYDRVRRAMGYDRINLIGVSYGTRAAQVYLRMFPGTVRSVTLDSVVPMQLALGQEHARMLDRAVSRVFEDCRHDETCNRLYPGHADELNALLDALRENPRWITITHPTTGEQEELRVTAETLAVAVRFLSYASETQALLPLLVHEALTSGRLERLAVQAMLVMTGLNEMLARGMELSVMCSEDFPFMNLQADDSDTLMGSIFLQAVEAQCSVWPRGQVADAFHDPVVSDVPVLLMSGERDPVTPHEYAALTAETFANSLALVARGQSHSVMKNPCLKEITTQFIEQGTLDGLETECVEQIRPAPFFTSLLGPDP
jgi:pimeloyl-ACP methyl ester carboxylesterase